MPSHTHIRRGLGLAGFLATVSLGAYGCSSSTDAPQATSSAVDAPFAPYPSALRALQRLEPFTPSGAVIADFGSPVRDQGKIASCASHGFLGLLENQLFNERGVTVDLGERFMLYANFLQTGNMGSDPAVIARFPEIASAWGILPEATYPYSAIAGNAPRFQQDAAQGLATDPQALTVDRAIAETPAVSEARSNVLQRSEFLGRLPQGAYPVSIPLDATLTSDARVPQVALGSRAVPCFAPAGSTAGGDRLAMTPREFAHFCLDLKPQDYFTCQSDLQTELAAEDGPSRGSDVCANVAAAIEAVSARLAPRHAGWLRMTQALVDRGQAVMVAVNAPAQWGQLSVWSSTFPPGGGHAVVVVGYVSYDELTRADEQMRGMLGQGIFDKLAAEIEPEYKARVAAGQLPQEPTALRDARLATKLASVMSREGGLLLFRNSWGANPGGSPVGVDGYQSMTFDYFVASASLISSRTNPGVAAVQWSPGGPGSCPAFNAPTTDAWLGADHSASVAKRIRGQLGAALDQCRGSAG